MAGKPIEIQLDVVSDGAVRGLERAADGLDDVARASEKVEDAAKDTARVIDRDLAAAFDEVKSQSDDAFDAVKKDARAAGSSISDDMKRGTRDAGEGMGALKENAGANAKEIGASFDGSFEGMTDGLQGFVSESLEGFGAVGLAAGVGLAAAIGITMQVLQQASEKANELTENAAEFAEELSTSSPDEQVGILRDRFREVQVALADVKSIWEVWQSRAVTNAERFANAIESGTVSAEALSRAFQDTTPEKRLEGLSEVLGDVNDRLGEIDESIPLVYNNFDQATDERMTGLKNEARGLEDVRTALEAQIAVEEQAVLITEKMATAQGMTVEAYEANLRALDEKAAAVEEAKAADEAYAATLAAVGEASTIYDAALATNEQSIADWATQQEVSIEEAKVAWEGAPLTLQEVLDELANRVATEQAFQDNLDALASRGFTALAEELRAGGSEANGAVTDMLAEGTNDQVQQFATDQGALVGKNLNQGAASGVRQSTEDVYGAVRTMYSGLPTTSINIPTKTTPPDERDLNAFINKKREVIVGVSFRNGNAVV